MLGTKSGGRFFLGSSSSGGACPRGSDTRAVGIRPYSGRMVKGPFPLRILGSTVAPVCTGKTAQFVLEMVNAGGGRGQML